MSKKDANTFDAAIVEQDMGAMVPEVIEMQEETKADPVTRAIIGSNVNDLMKSQMVKSVNGNIDLNDSDQWGVHSFGSRTATLSDGRVAILDKAGNIIGWK